MKKCPACGKWTLDFSEYFGRFRCLSPECAWMPASSAEREISLLRSQLGPQPIGSKRIVELGLTLTSFYDPENDALVFDFGLNEPTFDLPDDDGRIVWKMARHRGSVAGFSIFRAKEFAVSKVTVNIAARKETLEEALKRFPGAAASGRATRILINQVQVVASGSRPPEKPADVQLQSVYTSSLDTFRDGLRKQKFGKANVGT